MVMALKEIRPPEAYRLLQQPDAVLIDVRSTVEYSYIGHPIGALHLAIQEPPEWKIKMDFVKEVREHLSKLFSDNHAPEDRDILLLCRTGKRSGLAGEILIKAGFKRVYNILEGFEGEKDKYGHRNTVSGWRYHDLPWEQA